MPKKVYIGSGNLARSTKKMYVGVDGVARGIKKGYVGVDGVARQFWPGVGKTKFLAHFDASYVDEVTGVTPTITGSMSFTTGKFGQAVMMPESMVTTPTLFYDSLISIGDSEDFCVECWIKLSAINSPTERQMCRLIFADTGARAIGLGMTVRTDPYTVTIKNQDGTQQSLTVPGTIVTPTSWFHVALYRSNGTFYVAINGNVFESLVSSAMFDLYAVNPFFGNNAGISSARTLYFDEARVTVGDSRYGASDFTPPTAPFVVD